MNISFANPFRMTSKNAGQNTRRDQNRPATKKLSAQDAVKMGKTGEVILLDVRDHNELASSGKAKGALHIPLFLLNQQADPRHPEFRSDLKSGKPIAVYCASGARSGVAVRTLLALGFTEVHNIGGLAHWRAAGGEIERA